MNAVLVILGLVLFVAHPALVTIVAGGELAALGVVLVLILRAARPLCYPSRPWRTT